MAYTITEYTPPLGLAYTTIVVCTVWSTLLMRLLWPSLTSHMVHMAYRTVGPYIGLRNQFHRYSFSRNQ